MKGILFILACSLTIHARTQIAVDWNYVADTAYASATILTSKVSDEYIASLIIEQETALHMEVIEEDGDFVSRSSYFFPDTFKLVADVYASIDDAEGVYVWGKAETGLLSYQNFFMHFSGNLEVDWIRYYDDSLKLYAHSFQRFADEISFITSGTYNMVIWKYAAGVPTDTCIFQHENPGAFVGTTISYASMDEETGEIWILNETYDSLLLHVVSADCEAQVYYVTDLPTNYLSAGDSPRRIIMGSDGKRLYTFCRADASGNTFQVITCFDSTGNVLWSQQFTLDASAFIKTELYPLEADNFLVATIYFDASGYTLFVTKGDYFGDFTMMATPSISSFFDIGNVPDLCYDTLFNNVVVYCPDIQIDDRAGLLFFDAESIVTDSVTIIYASTILGQDANIYGHEGGVIYLINTNRDVIDVESLEITRLFQYPDAIPESALPMQTMLLYPNPTSEAISIAGKLNGDYDYMICNLSGQAVKSGRSVSGVIDVSHLQKGYYTIFLQQQATNWCGDFVKM